MHSKHYCSMSSDLFHAKNLTISRAVSSDSCRINSLCAWTLKKRHSPGLRFFAVLVVNQEPCLPAGTKLHMRHVESLVPIPRFHKISVALVLVTLNQSTFFFYGCAESLPHAQNLDHRSINYHVYQLSSGAGRVSCHKHIFSHTLTKDSLPHAESGPPQASTLSCVSTVTLFDERIDSRGQLHEPPFLQIRKAHGCQNLPSVL